MAKTAASDPTDVPTGVAEERVDALYGLPLDGFTPARDALAKELRMEGQREAAEWVKGLRKPSGPAWVVNQLARTQGAEADALRAAGRALREAHERLMAGEGRSDELRNAADRQREAIAGLTDKAHGLLDSSGHPPSPSALEKTRQTLEAVALDEETRTAFAVARMTRESRPVGLGLMGTAPSAPKATKARRAKEERPGRDESRAKERAKLRRELESAKEEERTQWRAVETAEQEVEQARREIERVQARLGTTEAELEHARVAHGDASTRVEELEEAVEKVADSRSSI